MKACYGYIIDSFDDDNFYIIELVRRNAGGSETVMRRDLINARHGAGGYDFDSMSRVAAGYNPMNGGPMIGEDFYIKHEGIPAECVHLRLRDWVPREETA